MSSGFDVEGCCVGGSVVIALVAVLVEVDHKSVG